MFIVYSSFWALPNEQLFAVSINDSRGIFSCKIFLNSLLLFAALQDLQSNIRQLMYERDEVQIRANDKDRQLAELRKEVNNVIDKKERLEQETERLKQHLVDVEDGYTQEALQTEEREQELRKKLQVCLHHF